MDTQTKKFSESRWRWTNERHLNFLNSMEASFVRTMLENNGRILPLDRYLPDSCESTLDLKRERRRRHSTSDILDPRVIRTEKKGSRQLSQPYISAQDQVVPQLDNIRGDKNEEDHHPGVPITSSTSAN